MVQIVLTLLLTASFLEQVLKIADIANPDGAQQGAHRIYHLGYLGSVAGEMCEEIA